MLQTTIKFSLLILTLWSLTACSSGRTITINQESVTAPTSRGRVIVAPIKRPPVKEEILLGNNRNNGLASNSVKAPPKQPPIPVVEEYRPEPVAERNEVMRRISFPVGEYNRLRKTGNSTVSGKVYLENAHTSLKVTKNKVKLWLNPVTSYSRQWYQESYLGGYKLSKTDKRLYQYLKFTYSNASGKFNFFGVPRGDYYLTGTISCGDECGYSKTKSIRLVREISVGAGVTTVDLMKHVP